MKITIFLQLNLQLTYGGPHNPPGGAAPYPSYGVPGAAGYGAVSAPVGGAHPPPIGFNPSIVQAAGAGKILWMLCC